MNLKLTFAKLKQIPWREWALPFLGGLVIIVSTVVSLRYASDSLQESVSPRYSANKVTEAAILKEFISRPLPSTIIPLPATQPPTLTAYAYLVRFLGGGRVILKQREWEPLPPASLTKILTALIAEERLAPDDTIPLSQEAKQRGGREGGKISDVPAGESLKRDDMLRLAMVASANDAALALAETVGRKEGAYMFSDAVARFVERMNKKAHEIGLRHSFFQNPTGLNEPLHRMNAYDLADLVAYSWYTHPHLFEISRTTEATVTTTSGAEYVLSNTNELLGEFPAILGSKTGYLNAENETLAMVYPVLPDRAAIIVLLGSKDRFGDGRKIIQWLEEAF